MILDVIEENYFTDRKRKRYVSTSDRGVINLGWEDFTDTNNWTPEVVSDPIRITPGTRQLEYGTFYKTGDKITFSAGYSFRGSITYFDVKIFNKRI